MSTHDTATKALLNYLYAAGAYEAMSDAELAAELLKLWGQLPSRHPLSALISEVIERLDQSLMETEYEKYD